MKGVCIVLIVLAFVLALAVLPRSPAPETARVCISGSCFSASVSRTPPELEDGLAGVGGMAEDEGMLFVLPREGHYAFWMEGMRVPLDIIWIGSGMEVVHIARGAQPCGQECLPIDPGKDAAYVLEINSGLSDVFGLSEGDAVAIDFRAPSA